MAKSVISCLPVVTVHIVKYCFPLVCTARVNAATYSKILLLHRVYAVPRVNAAAYNEILLPLVCSFIMLSLIAERYCDVRSFLRFPSATTNVVCPPLSEIACSD